MPAVEEGNPEIECAGHVMGEIVERVVARHKQRDCVGDLEIDRRRGTVEPCNGNRARHGTGGNIETEAVELDGRIRKEQIGRARIEERVCNDSSAVESSVEVPIQVGRQYACPGPGKHIVALRIDPEHQATCN